MSTKSIKKSKTKSSTKTGVKIPKKSKTAPAKVKKPKTKPAAKVNGNSEKKASDEVMFVYSIRISNKLFAAVEKKAKANKVAVSQVIRDALEKDVAKAASSNGGSKKKVKVTK